MNYVASNASKKTMGAMGQADKSAPDDNTLGLFQFSMREMGLVFVIVALICGWLVDHQISQLARLRLLNRSQSVLHHDGRTAIVLTEHFKPGFMGMQVWQVWRAVNDGSPVAALMTVEAAFQERQPTQPVLESKNGELIITDFSHSFRYSVDTKPVD